MNPKRRFTAIDRATARPPHAFESPEFSRSPRSTAVYGELLFSPDVQRKLLPEKVYNRLRRCADRGERLDAATAELVAQSMKDWALSLGVTHFCHWFQPLTGSTAEKQDAFISIADDGRPLERFSGNQLIQGEPDASSFPSGGLRSTDRARGYTVWDPASPTFIIERAQTRTLCIPSTFISYHGQALDEKTPLLRSMTRINEAAVTLLHRLGEKDVEHVRTTLGVEQEYFLIDQAFAARRPDLLMCGRSLLGATPPKGQELDDHYFGPIRERVLAFMAELDHELYRLGIPAKTRHNEVAPCQFELACLFEWAHLGADHNMVAMELMRTVARRHDFLVLLHEKPFAGINGSGKHCNWSLADNLGRNLYDPGKDPHENLRFLCFVTALLLGVHEHAELLRATVATSGNDHRLGANEAPPAIVSVFLGDQLTQALDAIEKGRTGEAVEKPLIELLPHLPTLYRDYTDRNRTSPMAFTNNKFEFRAVGSSQAVATPVAIMNAMVAEALDRITADLNAVAGKGGPKREQVIEVLRKHVKDTKKVRFEGDGYSDAWVDEATKRKLPNLRKTPEALDVFGRKSTVAFLSEQKILTPEETEARLHVRRERYVRDLHIEARLILDMVRRNVLPAAMAYERDLAASEQLAPKSRHRKAFRQSVSDGIEGLFAGLASVQKELAACEAMHDLGEETRAAGHRLAPAMASLRATCDELEGCIPDELWPFPTYQEMLFLY